MPQLVCSAVAFSHGPIRVLDGIDLTVADGDRIGVVGPNGIGKSTLLALLAGDLSPERGSVRRVPAAISVGLATQRVDGLPGEDLATHLARRTGVAALDAELEAAAEDLATDAPGAGDRYADVLDRWTLADVAGHPERRDRVLARLGLDPELAERPVDELSGGQRSRVGLAAVLLGVHDVLLLDEPTNDLDLDGLELLERFVLDDARPLVVVSHDRAFLERVTNSIFELDEHHRTGVRFDGGFAAWLEERATARRHAEEAYAVYTDQRDQLKRRAQREREWSTQGVKSASRASDNDKNIRFREMQRSENLAGKAKQTERAMERLEVGEKPWEGWELRLSFAEASRPGTEVAALHGAVVQRGDFELGPVDLVVTSGQRVVITGRNGSGKTTLLGALLGDLPLTGGTSRLGPSVRIGRLDQGRSMLAGDEALIDAYQAATGQVLADARSQLAKLGLDAEKVARPAASLSPGEQTRAVLAVFAATGVNCLVLDEPTNHLDLPAIEQLEVALDRFGGTVLLVTHDRRLLDAVRSTRRLVVEDGAVRESS
ncbi:MAG: ABC-F family ATP-binding cassette domain-containing protein [Actinomycetota bacterium]